MTKTYGECIYDAAAQRYTITRAEPHISLKLKSIFPRIPKTATPPYHFAATPQNSADLEWFMQRYPLQVSHTDAATLTHGKQTYQDTINELESILLPDYHPMPTELKDGWQARSYQLQGSQVHLRTKRLLLGDDLGLGKTLTAILSLLHPDTLPAAVVVQTHMPQQWQLKGIDKFTSLRTHMIKKTTPYSLPEADVYIFKYSQLAGWTSLFTKRFFRYAIFDEVQELRRHESEKYRGGRVLSENAEYTLGLSATPIYNYGDEIFNVLDLLNPGCLGDRWDFLREWAVPQGMHHRIRDPRALGTYLRENFLFLRRTRADVGRELPPVNTIVHTVGYDEHTVQESEALAKQLALRITTGSFVERGEAARELDMLARYTTGVAKAREVAVFVRMLLEAGEPVILAGWHRDVYDIWMQQLKSFRPVLYTGSETGPQKQESVRKFLEGETDLFIISLRSGAGLDGLQERCKTVVFGELDWSPKVHEQLIGRADRDGQQHQVTAFYLVSESGSDPVIINMLGLKSSQSSGIVDPLQEVAPQHSDESRIKVLAQHYLNQAA
ncbi:SNF2-related protein [Hymenobacter rigui]|nr:DEAD/DEAH box helicase [Hymenobacter rigui]